MSVPYIKMETYFYRSFCDYAKLLIFVWQKSTLFCCYLCGHLWICHLFCFMIICFLIPLHPVSNNLFIIYLCIYLFLLNVPHPPREIPHYFHYVTEQNEKIAFYEWIWKQALTGHLNSQHLDLRFSSSWANNSMVFCS